MFGLFSRKHQICVPLDGRLISLSSVSDPVFASEMMGKGWAIEPTSNTIVSPINGEVVMIADTKHAIGLKTKENVELLIHVGIDTVALNGEGFEIKVRVGDKIKIGDCLMVVDFQKLVSKEYKSTTMMILTNEIIQYKEPEKLGQNVLAGEVLLDY